MRALDVLIVGGGIAGLATASSLSASGNRVRLVEIEHDWRAAPTGLTLQAHTFRAFDGIGVADDVARAGFTTLGSRVARADGSVVREIPARPLKPGLPAAGGIMRPALQEILARRASDLGTEIVLGTTFSTIVEQGDRVRVDFTDGTVGHYDLVVGADGIMSKVRGMIFPTAPTPFYTGQSSFRLVARRPSEVDMMTMYLGTTIKAGVTPASQDLMFMWLLSPEPDDGFVSPGNQRRRLHEVLRGFGGVIGDLRDGLTEGSEIIYRPLKALMLDRPWNRGRVVLVGDAVHATTPHLGSGASAALEDAIVLAECLSASGDVERALEDFVGRRYERCRFIVETSLRIGELEVGGAPSIEQEELYERGLAVLAQPE